MLLKHVYMGWHFQRTLKLDISFSLQHFFISVGIFTQVASAPLKLYKQIAGYSYNCVVFIEPHTEKQSPEVNTLNHNQKSFIWSFLHKKVNGYAKNLYWNRC